MRRALLGGCLVAAICVASVFGQQPDDFGKKGSRGGGRGKAFKAMPAPRDIAVPVRWDYAVRMHADVQEMGGGDLQRGFNHMGELGWELVAVDGTFGQGRGHAYFKRPKNGSAFLADEDGGREPNPVPPLPRGPFMGMGAGAGAGFNFPPQKETTVIIPLKNSQANSMAQILSGVVSGAPGSRARIVPDQRTNRLILVAPDDKIAEIRKLIEELDQPAAADRRNTK